MPPGLGAEWIPVRPGSDAALMLALAHTMIVEGLHDRAFLDRYTVGFDRFRAYVTGESDGEAKSPEWAAAITAVPADPIRDLARRMAASRTMINATWSMQRSEYGEPPVWLTGVPAGMHGRQIGRASG